MVAGASTTSKNVNGTKAMQDGRNRNSSSMSQIKFIISSIQFYYIYDYAAEIYDIAGKWNV